MKGASRLLHRAYTLAIIFTMSFFVCGGLICTLRKPYKPFHFVKSVMVGQTEGVSAFVWTDECDTSDTENVPKVESVLWRSICLLISWTIYFCYSHDVTQGSSVALKKSICVSITQQNKNKGYLSFFKVCKNMVLTWGDWGSLLSLYSRNSHH